MRRHLAALAAMIVLAASAGRAAEVSAALIQPALDIQVSLASDAMDGVQQNAALVEAEAVRLGAPASRIAGAARQLTKTRKIEDARVAFGAMSEAIVAYMDAQKLSPASGVRVAFCPMVKKPWLQKDGELRNPYYGRSMLTCGSFQK
jgi:hypothetical protein